MRMVIGVFAALSVGVLSPAFGTDPPVAEAAKPTAVAPVSRSVDSSATTTPTSAEQPVDRKATTTSVDGTKPLRLIVGDAAAEARLKRLRAAGYKPEAHGDEVVFCRREPVLGSHFQRKVCNTAEQLESQTNTSQDELEEMQRAGMRGNPSG